MDAVKTYLDNVFAAFPRTERAQALKLEMLANMEEKYRALKAEGKSEHEAVGGVIANFGSIDEIAAELGDERAEQTEPESGISLSGDEARDFLAKSRKSGIWIGLGVWLILAGAAAMVTISQLTEAADGVGIFVMLLAVAPAVAIFIVNGMRMERYEKYEEKVIRLNAQSRADLEARKTAFMPWFTAKIVAGVVMIILAVGFWFFFIRWIMCCWASSCLWWASRCSSS